MRVLMQTKVSATDYWLSLGKTNLAMLLRNCCRTFIFSEYGKLL